MKTFIMGRLPITFTWTLTDTEGNPYSLSGADLVLGCRCGAGEIEIGTFEVTGAGQNILSWTMPKDKQHFCGIYSLRLSVTRQNAPSNIIYCNAFALTRGEVNTPEVESEETTGVVALYSPVVIPIVTGITDKADKVASAVAGNIAILSTDGNYLDSDIPVASVMLAPQEGSVGDILRKAADGIEWSNILNSYYSKSETYNKTQVDGLIGAIKQFNVILADTLPEASVLTMGAIYLVPRQTEGSSNIKDEYVTLHSGSLYYWEKLGSTDVDLSGYRTSAAQDIIDNGIRGRIGDIEAKESGWDAKADATSVYTKQQTDTKLAGKMDNGVAYTKGEMNDLLNGKANSADVYNKTTVDGKLAEKASNAALDAETTARQSADTALSAALAEKADDNDVVHNSGDEGISGYKSFVDGASFGGQVDADSLVVNSGISGNLAGNVEGEVNNSEATDFSFIHRGSSEEQVTLQDELDDKQDKLIAGEGISIAADGKTISAQGAGAVRYDAPQTLTSAQKLQARENIDAPSKDGYYEQMGVGYAKSLLGNGAATSEIIDFRPSGGTKDIGSGVETLKKIKGQSVVMNQLLPSTSPSAIVNGISFINNEDGTFSVSGTNDGSNNSTFEIISNIKMLIGHYYYLLGSKKSTPSMYLQYYSSAGQNGGDVSTPLFRAQVESFDFIRIRVEKDYAVSATVKYIPQLFDLTQMFGAGNEPTSVDDARIKWLESFGYIPYNEGTLLNFKGTGLKTIGVNAFDGTKAEVLGGVAYRILGTYATLKFAETLDGEQTDITPSSGLYTPEKRGYIFATGVSNEFQIAIEHSGGDIPTTYHPYEEHTLALPITSLKSNGVTIFPDGMKSAGTAHDELYGNSLGVITKAKKRIGVVDLGTLDWTMWEKYFYSNEVSDIIDVEGSSELLSRITVCCPKYPALAWGTMAGLGYPDKYISNSYKLIRISDSTYTSSAAFKSAMAGILLYYELAEPIEYTLDTPINVTTFVNDWGTETNLPQGKDAQGLPLTTPLNAEIVYAPNVQDAIRNLPKNYIGKESMDAILNAFKTAGIIASFTLTYDATSGKYNCSITKPTE